MKNFVIILAFTAIVTFSAVTASRPYVNDFNHYYNLVEIKNFLNGLVRKYPKLVSLELLGSTSKGKDITAVNVKLQGNNENLPKIIIESGLRAREWTPPMVSLYIIHMIVENEKFHKFLKQVHLIFIPMANPDGYQYSRDTDRHWNKNRRMINESSNCIGVDLNQNFNYKFKPVEDFSCNDNFPGLSPTSESETKAIQALIGRTNQLKMYLSFQALGTQILTPFSYGNEEAKNHRQLMDLGYNISAAIRKINQTGYLVANAFRLLPRPENGTSTDYAFGSKKASAALIIKLPRGGLKGYDVPEEHLDYILPEAWAGFLQLITNVVNKDIQL